MEFLSYSLLGGASLLLILYKVHSPLRHIPTVGPWSTVIPIVGRIVGFIKLPELIEEGYRKYKHGGIFKIADLQNGWTVVVTGAKLVEEVRQAPDDVLSFEKAVNKGSTPNLQVAHTVGQAIVDNPSHIPLVRGKLTRSIPLLIPDLNEEVILAFEDAIGSPDEWTSIKAWDTMSSITARVTNRMLVGPALCRDIAYCALMVDYTMTVVKDAMLLSLFPNFLKPIVARLAGSVPKSHKQAREFLRPLYEERQKKVKEYNSLEYPGKPNSFYSWLLDEATGESATLDGLTTRILAMNFASIHTTSTTLTHALYDLATYPQYSQPLREEAAAMIEEYGWTKSALDKMVMLDSFIKESSRMNGIARLSLLRMAVKPFTFSNGTTIPVGSFLSSPTESAMKDEANYGPDARTFNAFRFSDQRTSSESDDHAVAQNMTSPSPTFLLWGIGKHACPGRFFGVNEIKMLLVHIVLGYDVRCEIDGQRPKNMDFGPAPTPDLTATVLFRRRSSKK